MAKRTLFCVPDEYLHNVDIEGCNNDAELHYRVLDRIKWLEEMSNSVLQNLQECAVEKFREDVSDMKDHGN